MLGAPCPKSSFPLAGYSLDLALHLSSSFFMYFCVLTIIFFQSLIARNREKSRFLSEQKENCDRLVEEARLRGDVTAQLVAAQQRVVEMTSLAEEAPWAFLPSSLQLPLCRIGVSSSGSGARS